MRTETITVDTPDGPMAVYEAVPDDPRAALVVIQEAFGVNSHIEEVTRRFAEEGYHAVAPHMFHRTGSPVIPYGDFTPVIEHMGALRDELILADVDASLAHLAQAGWEAGRTGIVGFCFGGRVTFLVALNRAIGAGVGFYGGGIVSTRFPQFPALSGDVKGLQTPWLGLFGDQDQSIPVTDVDTLRVQLEDASVDTDVVLYEDAGHGFFCDQRDSFHREAAADGWSRAQAWFDKHLG